MTHYVCPDCKIRSDDIKTDAEAKQLLAIHQRHFCRPARRTVPAAATRTPRR